MILGISPPHMGALLYTDMVLEYFSCYYMTRKKLSPVINCANFSYQEKIGKVEADLDAEVDAVIEAAEMIERMSPAVDTRDVISRYLNVMKIAILT